MDPKFACPNAPAASMIPSNPLMIIFIENLPIYETHYMLWRGETTPSPPSRRKAPHHCGKLQIVPVN
jgi:hypothetical protein